MSNQYDDLIESGLLELYVLNQLSEEQVKEVESAMERSTAVSEEISRIESALYKYDSILQVKPPTHILKDIKQQLQGSQEIVKKTTYSALTKGLFIFCTLLSVATSYLIIKSNNQQKVIAEQQVVIDECERESINYAEEKRLQEELLNYNTTKIAIASSDKFPETQLTIYNNKTSRKNYLLIDNLPSINSNQSFQLWSLKGDSQPIPLDVFEQNEDNIIEVRFIEDTNAYAITIEPKGGQDTPTLENLIGVFDLQG